MTTPPTPNELLAVALYDQRFRQELSTRAGDDLTTLLSALQTGIDHPKAGEAIDWIEQLVSECREPIARYSAKQDQGVYPIEIFGFDCLCMVWAPEYGSTDPLLSHDAAFRYVESNWGEFLVNWQPEVLRFSHDRLLPTTQFEAAAKKAAAARERFQLGNDEYSNVGPDLYRRHRRRLLEGSETLTTQQLVLRLCSQSMDDKRLQRQLKVAGWHSLGEEIADARRQRSIAAAEVDRRSKEVAAAEAVAFIENFLAGREDPDGQLVEVAAREWAWGGKGNVVISHDESNAPNPIYARQRYYSALNAYATANNETKATPKPE